MHVCEPATVRARAVTCSPYCAPTEQEQQQQQQQRHEARLGTDTALFRARQEATFVLILDSGRAWRMTIFRLEQNVLVIAGWQAASSRVRPAGWDSSRGSVVVIAGCWDRMLR